MEKRALGTLQVSVLGLGTGRLASLGAGTSRTDAIRLIEAASDLGINLIDTADTYGSAACERLIGEALRLRPGRFHIGTKGGLAVADLPGPLRPLNQFAKKGLQKLGRVENFEPAVIRRRLDASLRRLQVDTIDIYYLHLPPLGAVRNGELIGVIEAAVRAGKIRHFGVSSDDPDVLRAAAQLPQCTVVQTRVGVRSATGFSGAAPELQEAGTHVVANHVLGSGTGGDRELNAAVDRRADELSLTRTGVLLRNAAAQPGVAAVLVGTSNPEHLRANVEACASPVGPEDRLDQH
jgi:aryl-alcohol dehydrogenase-like predicted oxidoreductase